MSSFFLCNLIRSCAYLCNIVSSRLPAYSGSLSPHAALPTKRDPTAVRPLQEKVGQRVGEKVPPKPRPEILGLADRCQNLNHAPPRSELKGHGCPGVLNGWGAIALQHLIPY